MNASDGWDQGLPALGEDAPSGAELRALQAVANHGCIRAAARSLGISYKTVESQLMACRRKLRGVSTAHAVAIALRRGLIQ